jgi:hypothetical protein
MSAKMIEVPWEYSRIARSLALEQFVQFLKAVAAITTYQLARQQEVYA